MTMWQAAQAALAKYGKTWDTKVRLKDNGDGTWTTVKR